MKRSTLVVLSAIGLLSTLAQLFAYFQTNPWFAPDVPWIRVESPVGALAALLAAVALFGPRPTRWFWVVPVALLAFFAAAFFNLAFADWNILHPFPLPYVPDSSLPLPPTAEITVSLIAGFVLYLVAATLYGFAGQAQGVKVGARTGLLVLLLLGVIPIVNILGLVGFLITSLTRKPA
jgi:hypothetical protein